MSSDRRKMRQQREQYTRICLTCWRNSADLYRTQPIWAAPTPTSVRSTSSSKGLVWLIYKTQDVWRMCWAEHSDHLALLHLCFSPSRLTQTRSLAKEQKAGGKTQMQFQGPICVPPTGITSDTTTKQSKSQATPGSRWWRWRCEGREDSGRPCKSRGRERWRMRSLIVDGL